MPAFEERARPGIRSEMGVVHSHDEMHPILLLCYLVAL
jgi:hypothetical protein